MIISPKVQESIILRVPKGVEINQEILENSGYFDDWYDFEPPILIGKDVRLEFSEIPEEFLKQHSFYRWKRDKDPTLTKDGDITYDY